MTTPLANPLDELVDQSGATPNAVWQFSGTLAGIFGGLFARMVLDRMTATATELGGRRSERRSGVAYALLSAGVVGIGATLGRLGAQVIVARLWERRQAVTSRT